MTLILRRPHGMRPGIISFAFRKYAQESGKQLFAWDGHYNNEGHRIVGETLVKFFREQGAL